MPGEVLGVLGPNGAGKTTVFNLIGGDAQADAGHMLLEGRSLNGLPPFERCRAGVGRTYQIPRPYGGMTVLENLLVAALFGGGMAERSATAHCMDMLERCGLLARANQLAAKLTLLDRKRLELARALASAPRLLLLDEIAGGLTDGEADQLIELVASLKSRRIAIVWIEHVLRAVMAVADRVLVLNFGERLAMGSPQAVMGHPDVRRIYLGREAVAP
ncbi:MAG: ABC transporter ATP-binding protein [Burkholderiales bacterium]|nr:MAG: ABC transporter ATP-binding protein [Burkholderiales bacterium]